MAANRCRAFKVMDDPWYSVHCSLPQGHGGSHAHRWTNDAEGHRVLPRKKQVEP